jgi:hypothetical protein
MQGNEGERLDDGIAGAYEEIGGVSENPAKTQFRSKEFIEY